MTGMEQIEHAVGEDDPSPVAWTRAANADACCRDRIGKLVTLTDPRCGCRSKTSTDVGGRKMPVSFTLDVTRIV